MPPLHSIHLGIFQHQTSKFGIALIGKFGKKNLLPIAKKKQSLLNTQTQKENMLNPAPPMNPWEGLNDRDRLGWLCKGMTRLAVQIEHNKNAIALAHTEIVDVQSEILSLCVMT